jgi:hypothetical protein
VRRILASAAVVGLYATVTMISNSPLKGDDNDRNRGDREREDEGELEVQTGFRIVPPNIKLNLKGKDIKLVGLGSYIVKPQGACDDCHTSYTPVRAQSRQSRKNDSSSC